MAILRRDVGEDMLRGDFNPRRDASTLDEEYAKTLQKEEDELEARNKEMLKADEQYAPSLSEQTEASWQPPSPIDAPPSPFGSFVVTL